MEMVTTFCGQELFLLKWGIFSQNPLKCVGSKTLEIMMPPEGRGFESLRLRHKKHRSSVRITVIFLLNINSRGGIRKIRVRVYDIYKWLIIFTPCIY